MTTVSRKAMKHTKAYWIKGQIEGGVEPTFTLPKNASIPLPDNWEDIRREVRERDVVCAKCGTAGYAIHHVDKNRLNDNPDNLIYLCIQCHFNKHH